MMNMTIPLSRSLPHSLTRPIGITVLPPDQRVTTAELERRDAEWRALREAAYARAWAEDATLVGSSRGSILASNRRRRKALLKFIKWMEGRGAGAAAAEQQRQRWQRQAEDGDGDDVLYEEQRGRASPELRHADTRTTVGNTAAAVQRDARRN